MGLAGSQNLPVTGPVLALAGFAAGALITGYVMRTAGSAWATESTWVLGAVALVQVLAALLVVGVARSHDADLVITAALGVAMGAQAGTARHVGVADVSTVVVTGAITAIGADVGGGSPTLVKFTRRAGSIVALVAGALVGSLVLRWHIWAAFALAAMITAAVAAVGHRTARPRRSGTQPAR
jgi:uncharacterized membrane protein YoaK (UPF0700 family)